MPKQVDHQQRRAMIAAAAANCIAKQGLQGTTMRVIAECAGVSKGIVEHYFTNKDAVIAAALEQVNAGYLGRERELTAGLSGLLALQARLRCVLPLDAESRQAWKIRLCFWSVAAIHTENQRGQQIRLALTRERYLQDLREAHQNGDIPQLPNLEQIATDLGLLMAGAACGALLDPDYYSPAYLERLIDRTLEYLTLEQPQ
jgi:AcrR family transcriptional regulator